jgi:hypothetical protein
LLEVGSERAATRGYARDRSHAILFHLLCTVDRPLLEEYTEKFGKPVTGLCPKMSQRSIEITAQVNAGGFIVKLLQDKETVAVFAKVNEPNTWRQIGDITRLWLAGLTAHEIAKYDQAWIGILCE